MHDHAVVWRSLVDFFDGVSPVPLGHAVTQAYFWSDDQVSCLSDNAGFEVLDGETRQDHRRRAHADIAAITR
jgi:hypothetical protein